MNLILLVVWCSVLLSYTVAIPRRRQIKYPVTKTQNFHKVRSRPTALEELVKKLLPSNNKESKHYRKRREERRPFKEYDGIFTSPLQFDLSRRNLDKPGNEVNSCIDSFGNQSPLCKPRQRFKKSFVGIPDIRKRLFRSDERKNMTITTPNTPDDFFGIFKSSVDKVNPNALFTGETYKYELNTSSSVTTTLFPSVKSSTITSENTTSVNTSGTSTFQRSTSKPIVRTHTTESIGMPKNQTNRMILPGRVQKIESQPQLFYLEEVGPKIHSGAPDNKAIEETEGDGDEGATDNSADFEESTEETTPKSEESLQLESTVSTESILSTEDYSKTQCESDTNEKCLCSLSSVSSDLQNIFSQAILAEEIMAEIASVKCRIYTPKPSGFDLNTNTKPRVLKGKHTPFAVDNRQGAKEVKEDSLNEYIAYSTVDDGISRVFVTSDVKIPCFPKPDIHLSASDADHVKYTWTFGNKKQAITQGRITEDTDGDGSLTIEDIELTDARNYSCEIDYIHPDTGERTTDVFVHSLSVVTLPIVSARAMVHYRSSAACDESLLEMFEMYLPQQLEKTICSADDRAQLCRVAVHSPVCHSGDQGDDEGSMEMSLNLDVFIHRPAVKELPGSKARLCDPDCHLLITFKLLQIFRESVQEVALVPITSDVQDGGSFTPMANSVRVKYIFGCIGGYYLDNGFCLACPKGTYSDDGATECQQCPLHTYSVTMGTRRCTPCKYLWMPVCNEHFETINIMMIVYVVAGVVVLLGAFVAYYFFCFKGQTWQEVLKKGQKEKMAKSERIRSRKETKRAREAREMKGIINAKQPKKNEKLDEEELLRLLQSSGESGTESEPEMRAKEKHVRLGK